MKVVIYTDGGADPNPGYGGWAAILKYGDREKVLTGNAVEVTNNRMELQAAISALQALNRPCEIDFFTDSQYLQKGITEWIDGWAARNWQKKGQPIQNADLWQQLWKLRDKHQINWQWVRGHAGNTLNERVDKLATEARLEITPAVTVNLALPRLYVRASCKGNPGPGGWGAVIEYPDQDDDTIQISGNASRTTNNRMELEGVLAAIAAVDEQDLQILTTSDYVFQGATQWIKGWRRRKWQKKEGTPIANADLWQAIDRVGKEKKLHWVNVKGQQKELLGLKEATQLARKAAENLA